MILWRKLQVLFAGHSHDEVPWVFSGWGKLKSYVLKNSVHSYILEITILYDRYPDISVSTVCLSEYL